MLATYDCGVIVCRASVACGVPSGGETVRRCIEKGAAERQDGYVNEGVCRVYGDVARVDEGKCRRNIHRW